MFFFLHAFKKNERGSEKEEVGRLSHCVCVSVSELGVGIITSSRCEKETRGSEKQTRVTTACNRKLVVEQAAFSC